MADVQTKIVGRGRPTQYSESTYDVVVSVDGVLTGSVLVHRSKDHHTNLWVVRNRNGDVVISPAKGCHTRWEALLAYQDHIIRRENTDG